MASHPTKIGKYPVEGILGRGGMGVVYKAVDSHLGRYVAIKMITSGGDPSLLERFKSEARSTSSLQCPNIVTVYDSGEQDGNPYLVMQYLEGSSLEAVIQKGASLTLSEKLGIIIDVCNGLAYAHQRGVIHRDIKPGNIMVLHDGVNDGMAVIVDFGIARIGGDTRITRTDQIVGSIHYMSAEQLQAKELDNRTDVYATGVVLFQLLTGALPFDSPETAATLLKIVNDPPPPLSAYLKEYPVELEEIVSRALAKKREERYASAKDLAFDLGQVQDRLKSETIAQLLRRAETSLQREEFTRAREHLQQAQRIDRQNTKVQKMLSAVQERLRQLQQIEQARALRGQADEAYLEQRYDDALRLLEQAVALDGNNSDLQVLRDSVRSAKERAMSLRRALRRAEAALQDGDLDEAQNAVSEAFKIDPQDTQAKALRVVIAQQAEEKLRHEKVKKLLDEARSQITSRNLTAAFNILKNVETLDPTSNELQTVLKLATAAREQEKRRAETEVFRQQIEAALREEDFVTAIAKADEGLLKFPREQSLLKLKALADAQRLRVGQKKFVREQFSAANSLADSGQLRQAVALLERALQKARGNSELESLRETFLDRLATEEAGQSRRQAVESTLAEGERILRESGAKEATRYLDSKVAEYSDSQPFRELYDAVREREALETLDTRLANEPNPASQFQIAEDALRQNQNNRWIQQRVADLRQIRDQFNAVIKQAQGYEAAGRFSEAMQQWQQLAKSYPQVSEFNVQVRRIANLLESKKKVESTVAESRKKDKPADSYSVTEILNSATVPDVEPSKEESISETASPPARKIEPPSNRIAPPAKATPRRAESTNRLSGPRKYIVAASALGVLVAVGYLLIGGGKKVVRVKIATSPVDADVTVGTQKCHAPCELRLQPGTYDLRANRDGYETVIRHVPISADTKSLPLIALKQIPPPPPPPQGTLIVLSNVDDAEVFVDGDQKGVTKHKKYEGMFDVGSHQITLRKSEYKDSEPRSLEIAKERPASVNIPLEKGKSEVGYIVLTTNPEATVAIDDRIFPGKVSNEGRWSQSLSPGTHKIQVSLEGYDTYHASADVRLGEKYQVHAKLNPTQKPQLSRPPTIVSFTPDQNSIQPGQPVMLSWNTENANEWSIEPIGPVGGSSTQDHPLKTTTYTLTAKGPGGTKKSEPVTVTVNLPQPSTPPTAKLVVFPENIASGQPADLRWESKNAMEVTLDGEKVQAQGTRKIFPSESRNYRLVSRGPGGEATDVAHVEVRTLPPPPPSQAEDQNAAVQRLLDSYVKAFQAKDRFLLRHIWPSMSDKTFKEMQSNFKDAQSIRLNLRRNGPAQFIDNTGIVPCIQDAEIKVGGQVQSLSYAATFHVRRLDNGGNDEWIIDGIDYSRH